MKKQPPDTMPAKKFMFDLSFDNASVIHRAQERKPVLMKPEQIDELKQESFNSGLVAGRVEEKEAQAEQMAAILTSIDKSLATLMENFETLHREQDVQTRQLVMAIAKKILPDFIARNGMQEIEPLIAEAIREMAREPRLVVRVNELQFDTLSEKAQALATARAYPGKIIVLADADIALGDCRVEWADGGIERNTQATWNAVEQTINPSV